MGLYKEFLSYKLCVLATLQVTASRKAAKMPTMDCFKVLKFENGVLVCEKSLRRELAYFLEPLLNQLGNVEKIYKNQ